MTDQHPELPLDPDRPVHLTVGPIATVVVGGAVGTTARYEIAAVVTAGGAWPVATFAVNVVGAFLLGVLLEALARRGPDAGRLLRLRLLLGTGFLGGFTTYSTFAAETTGLWRDGATVAAVSYAAATLVVGLLASVLGIWAAAAHGRANGLERPR